MARSPLRQKQAQLTRRLIMESLAEVVAEDGALGFTVQDVASRAGVSLRSVYHHYPSREALLEALYEWIDAEIGGPQMFEEVPTLEDLPGLTEKVFAAFETVPAVVHANVIASLTLDYQPRLRRERSELAKEQIRATLPRLDEGHLQRAFAIVDLLTSSHAWLFLKRRAGLTSEEAGAAASWALGALIDDLKSRDSAASAATQEETVD